MNDPADLAELVDCAPDERLLADDLDQLPESVGRPEAVPQTPVRRRLVGTGAALTGVSLIGGVALVLVGVVAAISSGIDAGGVAAVIVGVLLIATHWGWVHVAEVSANALEARSHAGVLERRRQWLATIEPYTRFEVSTSAEDDGSIVIYSMRHQPVRSGQDHFTFVREIEHRELHSADEPAAAVTERAEALRRQAALATQRERERYEIAADAYHAALLDGEDEEQRRLAHRAASEALSRQINSNLRDPPLVE